MRDADVHHDEPGLPGSGALGRRRRSACWPAAAAPRAWDTLIDHRRAVGRSGAGADGAGAGGAPRSAIPPASLGALERASDPKAALLLLRDGFDMLAEDFAEERFYARDPRAVLAGARGLAGAHPHPAGR